MIKFFIPNGKLKRRMKRVINLKRKGIKRGGGKE